MSVSPEVHIGDFNWKNLKISTGHNYHYIDQAPRHQRKQIGTVLCFHGFPDFAYGWRYQVRDLVERGYRVIVPDQLGYGGTDKPIGDLKPYTLRAATNAAVEILEHEGLNGQVVVLGHDWGGMIAWRFLQYHTQRVKCFASLCTPPAPAAQPHDPVPVLEDIVKQIPTFGYQLWLSSPEGEQKINKNVREFIMLSFWDIWSQEHKPDDGEWSKVGNLEKEFDKNLDKLKKAHPQTHEFQEYVDVFVKGKMSGPLNWYKTRVNNYHDEIEFGIPLTFPTKIPCLMLAAENDGALPPSMTTPETLKFLFPGGNIEKQVIADADHWLLQDPAVRDKVVKTVGNWVDAHFALD